MRAKCIFGLCVLGAAVGCTNNAPSVTEGRDKNVKTEGKKPHTLGELGTTLERRKYDVEALVDKYWCTVQSSAVNMKHEPGQYHDLAPLLELLLHCEARSFRFHTGSKFDASTYLMFYSSRKAQDEGESELVISVYEEWAIAIHDKSSSDRYMCRPSADAFDKIKKQIEQLRGRVSHRGN